MKRKEEYDFLSIRVTDYKAYVDASINHDVRDKRYYHDDAKVYKFSSHVEITGICTWPEEKEGDEYVMTIYGSEIRTGDFDLTLSDCHVLDERSIPKFKKVRGKEVPIYDVPKGLGTIEKQRGIALWSGCLWVSPQGITNMLNLLPNVTPLYMFIHERNIERNRWIVGFTLQTSDPAEE